MNLFGPIVEFNNLIGEPVNRYRQEYKSLEKFGRVNGFSYNSNESLIAVSGSIENQKDIYLLSANSSNMKKLLMISMMIFILHFLRILLQLHSARIDLTLSLIKKALL